MTTVTYVQSGAISHEANARINQLCNMHYSCRGLHELQVANGCLVSAADAQELLGDYNLDA